jgi:heterotetrameric sarcosine oxidase gamma subunit
VPMDLRLAACPVGTALRTQVNHMNAILLRTGDYGFEIMVFRSMARTAWHEIETALHMVAARAGTKV